MASSTAALGTALALLLLLGFLLLEVAPLLNPGAPRPQPLLQGSAPPLPPPAWQLSGQAEPRPAIHAGEGQWLLPFRDEYSAARRCFEPALRRWCLSTAARGDAGAANTLLLEIESPAAAGAAVESAELITGQILDWAALSEGRAALVALADRRLLWVTATRDRGGRLQLLSRPALSGNLPAPVRALRAVDARSEELLALHGDGSLGLLRPGTGDWRRLREADPALADGTARLYAGAGLLLYWRPGGYALYDLREATRAGISDLWRAQSRPGRPEPERLWQAQAGSANASSHLNLWPLVFGSLKAAVLGLLVALPLAVGAAVHALQYRSARVRHRLKTSAELCEAVPTVILGLIAMVWIAPWLQQHLGLLLGGLLGWLLALLLPARKRWQRSDRQRASGVLLRTAGGLGAGLLLAAWLEPQLPGGSVVEAMALLWGIEYQAYNALLVGLMVGLALAPGLYSLADEALQSAPAGLQEAALALGASRRDTLFGLLLPAAAPGLLAAALIGLGRGLGETLVVLMVSGNAPLTGAGVFEGLRAISATLVLEAPQAVPGSLHYQALLLAALLLTVGSVSLNLLAQRWIRQGAWR